MIAECTCKMVEAVTTQPTAEAAGFFGPPTLSGIFAGFCVGMLFAAGFVIWDEYDRQKKQRV